MSESELRTMKMPLVEIDPLRLGDDPEREKAVMFVRGWNSALDAAIALEAQKFVDHVEARGAAE